MQIYVINLDRSPDRLAHITDIFSTIGLEISRVRAVDGKALPEEEFAHWTRKRNWPRSLTRAEVGCFLSHRQCLAMGLEQGDPYFAVFEDDIVLSPQAIRFLQSDDWIVAGVDMIKLDTADINCLLEPLRPTHIAPYHLGRLVSKHYCTGGYIISRAAAARLLDLTGQAFAPIDEIYFNPDCGVLPALNVQQLTPAVVVQAGLESTIRQPSSPQSVPHSRRRHPWRNLPQRLRKEGQRFYRRIWRPFWLKGLKNYYWGKIPFR